MTDYPAPDWTRALEPLRGSIAKWEAIVRGTLVDHGTDNCPLCTVFYYIPLYNDEGIPVGNCNGCPVAHYTANDGCADTPYENWSTEQNKLGRRLTHHKARFADTPHLLELAKAELSFLRSLLPKEHQCTTPQVTSQEPSSS